MDDVAKGTILGLRPLGHELINPAVIVRLICSKWAKRLLDWRPGVDLEQGVARLCAWYRENRDWAKNINTED